MHRTLIDLVRQAANEIGIPEPQSLAGSLDEQSKQLLSLANREGSDFSALANGKGGWQALHKEYTFNTVDGTSAYDLPSDFEYFAQRTFWDGAMRWELLGPIAAQKKQALRYGLENTGPRRMFYVRNNQIYLDPTPTVSGQTIAFDYYSNAWCESASGTPQTMWLADTDVYLLDENCFIQGMKWRFLRSKGFDYAQEKIDYDNDCQRVMGRDGGSPDLFLGYTPGNVRLLNYGNVPDTGYGQ